MKLEAITVCVNYSDFLCWALIENKGLFDKWVIVTDTKDHKTKKICDHHGVTCVQTDIFYKNGGFNKYAGVNEGLKHLTKDGWVLFLDGDIVLPPITRRVLENLKLDESCVYGLDRVDCTGLKEWVNYCNYPNMVIDNWLLTTGSMGLGGRIVHYYGQWGDNGRFGGWKPLGFFQLVHCSSFKTYPENEKGADHADMVFAMQYARDKRIMIPEIIAIHLESIGSKWGDNWSGRRSKNFGWEEGTEVSAKVEQQDSKILTALFNIYYSLVKLIKKIILFFRKKPKKYKK